MPCALDGCEEPIEQSADGGPRRLYCSAAHRAAARKQRAAARTTPEQEAAVGGAVGAAAVGATPAAADDAAAEHGPAAGHVADPGVPPAQPHDDGAPVEEPAEEPAGGPAGGPSQDEESPAVAAEAAAASGPPAPAADAKGHPTPRRLTSRRVPRARKPLERDTAGPMLRRRAVASLAVVSLIAGGSSYILTTDLAPNRPPATVPPAPDPALAASQWETRAEVALASINKQLDSAASAEASWLQIPEARRGTRPPAAVQALLDRKSLLEQQRVTLESQLATVRSLPKVASELDSTQAEIASMERALSTAPATSSIDQVEASRQLEQQRELQEEQHERNQRELDKLRDGVDRMLAMPMPDVDDHTSPVVERVKQVIKGLPDPASPPTHVDRPHHPEATLPRSRSHERERQDVGRTAPPDPSRDALAAGGGGDHDRDRGRDRDRDDDRDESRGEQGDVSVLALPAGLAMVEGGDSARPMGKAERLAAQVLGGGDGQDGSDDGERWFDRVADDSDDSDDSDDDDSDDDDDK